MSNVSEPEAKQTAVVIKNVNKRDGRRRKFNPAKIELAIKNALVETKTVFTDDEVDVVVDDVIEGIRDLGKSSVSTETIGNLAESVLMKKWPAVAKAYILYREERNRVRTTKSEIVKTIKEITESELKSSNILRDNANEAGATPAGTYGKIASETNKMYNLLNNISRKYAQEHKEGYLHCHDLNQYNLTFNCLFAPIGKLLTTGFDSGTGYLRSAGRIESACQLTAVIMQLQSNQQYGGIASDNLDFDLAPFVDKSFKKNLAKELLMERIYKGEIDSSILDYAIDGIEWDDIDDDNNPYRKAIDEIYQNEVIPSGISLNQPHNVLCSKFSCPCVKASILETDHDTFEGMEGLVANLNSLQSRSGNQVPFSSINFGLNTSKCGRMVSRNLIKAQYAGLGDGLTAIFPILIFKVMKGYTKNPDDPNYDLYLKSIKCLARRFYPNFVSVDSSFNKPYVRYDYREIPVDNKVIVKIRGKDDEIELDCSGKVWTDKDWTDAVKKPYEFDVGNGEYWEVVKIIEHTMLLRKLKPETTIAAMGCRSRVIGNINGPDQTTARGNFAFHTINLPRLAIETHIEVKDTDTRRKRFFEKLDAMLEDAKGSLIERFNLICRTKTYENYPFTMQQGLYLTSDDEPHNVHDFIAEVLKQSTLSIGYIGIAEVVRLITGKIYGVDHEEDAFALSIVKRIRDFCDATQKETHLNWSCFATPAEAVAGRFANIDKNKFSNVKGLEDVDLYRIFGKGYYTNSHMMDFSLDTTLENKIATEAPFHKLTNAGHIFYYKVNGDPSKNIDAVKSVIDAMYDGDLGYYTVTLDSDDHPQCGFHGIIDNECPKCGCKNEDEFVRVRRITGYLTGSVRKGILHSWNDGKLAELKDRKNI